MKTIIIIQARMGSTRLPGKVMLDLSGKTVLQRVVERMQQVDNADEVVVATSDLPIDDVIQQFCTKKGFPVFRGSEQDVLARFFQAASTYKADFVCRVTSDCPFIDPEVTDQVIMALTNRARKDPSLAYVSNTLQRTFPRGMDTEAFTFSALEEAFHKSSDPFEREHVTPYIYRNFPSINISIPLDSSHIRLTLDTIEDYHFLSKLYYLFVENNQDMPLHKDVLHCLSSHPDWLKINSHIKQKET